jgi:hypothetical protein
MSISFKKRLKWYGGIFLIASIVLGVNMLKYDKVKFRYAIKTILICDINYFYEKVNEKSTTQNNPYGLQTVEQKNNKTGLLDGLTPVGQKKGGLLDGLQTVEQKKASTRQPMTMADEYRQKKKRMLDGLEPRKHGKYDHIQPIKKSKYANIKPIKPNPNDPRNGLSKSQIAEAEKEYQECLSSRRIELQEAKAKKDRTENTMGVASALMVIMLLLTLIDFVILQFRKRKLKIQTGEITPMENKKITKIMILVFLVWGILSFVIAQSGYRHRFDTNAFLLMNIPTILIFGYLWVTDKFTLK